MKLEALTVALRPRTSWEACELGMALVRRHAGAIWKPWLLVTLPMLALLNLAGWALDQLWLAGVLMWWLKPWFDRIPLYVISRAVFGDVPGTRQTVREQFRWGARWWLAYLTWRRLGPARSLYLPVDLLEGGSGAEARERRAALGAPVYGVCALLTLVCSNFELLIIIGAVFGGLMFIPFDYLPDTVKSLWDSFLEQPDWMNALFNVLMWLAVSVIEPFYVGAGFGLYLNRRTEIEGWDIEIVFRRLRARLAAAAAPTLMALCLCIGLLPDAAAQQAGENAPATEAVAPSEQAPAPAQDGEAADESYEEEDEPSIHSAPIRAFDESKKSKRLPSTLNELYGDARSDDRALRDAVAKAMKEPAVAPKRKETVWKSKQEVKAPKIDSTRSRRDFSTLSEGLAAAVQIVLWTIVALIVAALLFSIGRWLGWFRGGGEVDPDAPGELRTGAMAEAEPLPDDIPTAIHRLWNDGRRRDALALMYRAAVESMATRAEVVLVPGATEAQCLRASRKLSSAEDRDVFARAVRTWQYAAYAQTLPASEDFDDLVGQLSQRFGWAA
ncbi:DUF4129 domain-containing protein [Lysobacter sp. CA199]|uniref:DUF4129 domain-containing protein n=1 Tax=Lysobacter sp. CA199 TaxID=3455608 RepID=UPI003F8D4DEC